MPHHARTRYAAAALVVLSIEILIALFVRDRLVRPYLGDSLAVIFVYLALRAATPLRAKGAVVAAMVVAIAVEFGQLVGLVQILGLGDYRTARVVLGTDFSWWDFVAYGGGALLVLTVEAIRAGRGRTI